MKSYDVAVIGMGTMGSFAAAELARRGLSVVAFDQFNPPHGRGSHSGGTRVFRIAYPEGTGYVRLAQQAGQLWDQASEEFGLPLLHRTGMLYMGPPESTFIREIAASASTNRLEMKTLRPADVSRTFPAFEIPENYVGLFDKEAGWLDVDASILGSREHAKALGVDCRFEEPVLRWQSSAQEVRVYVQSGSVTANSLIITAGAWAGDLLRDLHLPLTLKRKVLAWFEPRIPEAFAPDRMPVFAFPENLLYGFPNIPGVGVKLAEHEGGATIATADSPVAAAGPADTDPLAVAITKYMPRLAGSVADARSRLLRAATCLYTVTPDENFIVDCHPEFPNVAFAAGFSGHGFKFAPLIGMVLSDLIQQGKTKVPVGFLSLDRFQSPSTQRNQSRRD